MLLEHVWKLMGMPCGKCLVVMRTQWLPLLDAAGDLDKPYATQTARAELTQMSAATIDRYWKPARDAMRLRGIATTKPTNSLRTSITIRTVAGERDVYLVRSKQTPSPIVAPPSSASSPAPSP